MFMHLSVNENIVIDKCNLFFLISMYVSFPQSQCPLTFIKSLFATERAEQGGNHKFNLKTTIYLKL